MTYLDYCLSFCENSISYEIAVAALVRLWGYYHYMTINENQKRNQAV
jgi:hypothetical protein